MYFCNYLLSSQNAIPKRSSTSVEILAALVPRRRASTASVYNQKNSFHSFFSPPPLPKATFPRLGKEMEERYRMTHYLRYCCAMLFALFSFLLATPLSAQAQPREAYVAQSADETTLTFYYDALRATRTGTTWGIEETKKEGDIPVPAWAGTSQEVDKTTTRVVFDASFRDFRPTTTAKWFYNCKALKQIEGLEYLNTSEVKDMSRMFAACKALTSLDLKNFNTQNVTDMSSMFSSCWALTSLDLQHFNTQNVTNMSWMFFNCMELTSLDLKNFNTQNATNMSRMLSDCAALTSLDLKNFNTQNVTNMSSMFSGCAALTSLDLKNFNTQNVTNMSSMFSYCVALTSLDLKNFDTQYVTDMSWMFSNCWALTTIHSNTTWWCPESENMFAGCTKLKGAVAYDKNKVDAEMANPETGYFTAKPTMVESR